MAEFQGVLLAAGSSTRYGNNKLLANINGRPMIVCSAAALAPCDRIMAVVPAADEALMTLLNTLGVDIVLNHEPQRGMGYSIAHAVKTSADSDGWCLLPADMPYVNESTTRQLLDAMRAGSSMAAPFYQGRRGHPVAFSHRYLDALATLDGDTGARGIVEHYADQLTAVDCDDAGVLVDIDTVEDMEQQGV